LLTPYSLITRALSALLVILALAACASPQRGSQSSGSQTSEAAPGSVAPKTLTVLMNDEPKKLGPIGPGGGSLQSSATTPLFHEGFLAVIDDAGNLVPRLTTSIPAIETGDWRVLPSGEMETTWKLRPGAFWHDGTPFTAHDVVFTWQVWQDPQVQLTRDVLSDYVDSAEALDDTTVLLHWKSTFGFISGVATHSLLPRHLLEAAFQSGDREQFNNHRWNTVDYVGLGPFRLKDWSLGSFLTLEAFDRYFLGKPKLQTIVARFVTDPNVLATVMLAGQADMNIPWGATADSVTPVEGRWKESKEGTVFIYPGPSLRFMTYQARDEYQRQPALKQAAVRQALNYALDREAIVDLLYHDRSLLADSWYVQGDPRRAQFADVITTYGYDPRRAAQLLEQQGWRAIDGTLVNGSGERFETTLTGTSESGQAVAAFSAYWRQIGVGMIEEILTPAQTQDREWRAKYSGFEYTANVPVRGFLSGRVAISQIPGSENRWTGSNRNGLVVPELDRLMKQFDATIDAGERTRVERDMIRLATGDAHFTFLFMYPHQWMVRSSVTGIVPSKVASTLDDWPKVTWNVHEWDLRG